MATNHKSAASITDDGLVGRITEVGLTFSKITTVLDPALHVGCYNARTRDMGTITGRIEAAEEGLCSMELVSRSSTAAKDDIIVTAGSTGLFPKDLVIGRIVSISTESDGKSMTAMIQPAADVEKVTNVLVITSFRGQGSSMDELESLKPAEETPQEEMEAAE
jgi:rod shape-determining protein MreC